MQQMGYGAFLSTKHVPSIVVSMTFARLPMGIVTLILVLFVSIHYGAAVSGMATAAFTAGVACFGPVFGRLVDRGHGPVALRILGMAGRSGTRRSALQPLSAGIENRRHPQAATAFCRNLPHRHAFDPLCRRDCFDVHRDVRHRYGGRSVRQPLLSAQQIACARRTSG